MAAGVTIPELCVTYQAEKPIVASSRKRSSWLEMAPSGPTSSAAADWVTSPKEQRRFETRSVRRDPSGTHQRVTLCRGGCRSARTARRHRAGTRWQVAHVCHRSLPLRFRPPHAMRLRLFEWRDKSLRQQPRQSGEKRPLHKTTPDALAIASPVEHSPSSPTGCFEELIRYQTACSNSSAEDRARLPSADGGRTSGVRTR